MIRQTIIVEKSEDGSLWGRVEGIPDYLPLAIGGDLREIEDNIRELMDDYIRHEGQVHREWRHAESATIAFHFVCENAG